MADGADGGEHVLVLVVEDEEHMRAALAAILASEGFDVETAADGVEAVRRVVREPRPRAVVSDWVMPGVDGVELAAKVHDILPEVPVVLLSGSQPERLTERGRTPGVSRLLRKPDDIERLPGVVRELLAHGGAGGQASPTNPR